MALKITISKPFIHIETSIGDLYLFDIRVKELIGIEKKLGTKIEELSSKEFFKRYLPFFAYLKEDLIGEELERPENYTLKGEDIDKLSNDELEKIAKIFIEQHSYLYKNLKNNTSKKEDGTTVISLKEEIDESLLKRDEEDYVQYVHRVVLEKYRKDQEEAKKLFSSFSAGLSNDILKTIGIGESLKNSFNSLNQLTDITKTPVFKPNEYELPKIDFTEIHRQEEKRRLAPFKDLSSKMDLMIDAEKQTVSFMDEVYKTQVQIADELKTSSDSANENSKLNIKYTHWIIALTVISTLITTVSFGYTVWFDNDSEQMIKTNEGIKSSTVEINLKLEKLTEILIEQNKIQSMQIKSLNDELKNVQSKN